MPDVNVFPVRGDRIKIPFNFEGREITLKGRIVTVYTGKARSCTAIIPAEPAELVVRMNFSRMRWDFKSVAWTYLPKEQPSA